LRIFTTDVAVVVTEPSLLDVARTEVEAELALVDDAANRFRADSQIRLLTTGPNRVGPILSALVTAALWAAELTDGDVDPTVGAAMNELGYDRDIDLVRASSGALQVVKGLPSPGWRRLRLDGDLLDLPAGVELDLGATAKAVAADRAAHRVAERLGTGVLVALGGDIATAGAGPVGGWQIRVEDRPGDPIDEVALPAGSAIATSSTQRRTWERGNERLHHIVDPRTGRPATPVWRTVTVAAQSCLLANAVTTASVVRGSAAPDWVGELGLPGRFVAADGAVVTTAGWPRREAA